MGEIDIISESQLIEGIVGALGGAFIPLMIFYNHNKRNMFIIGSIITFFLTWIARKICLNNYLKYIKQQGKPDYMFKL